MAGAAGSSSSKSVKKICAIVEERDKIIRETDVRIEYYKNALEKVLNEIKRMEKATKEMADKYMFVQKLNNQLEFIKTSLTESRDVARQSLINHHYLEQMLAKELKTKEKEKQLVEVECRNLYSEAQEKLNQNSLYQELESQKVEFLKLDIKKRDLEVKIRQRKKINAQKKEIEEKIFYTFFVELAEDYLIEQKLEELRKLKIEELEAVQRLFAVQEELKKRQKLGTPVDKIKRIANITFGTQECPVDSSHTKVVADPPPQKKEPKSFNEKLCNMLHQEELKNVESPKVHILNQKVMIPAFVAPNFVAPEKRKNKTIALSRKWQKLMNNSKSSFSQETEKRLSQSSQQSQLSQPTQLTPETAANKYYESSIQNTDTNKIIMQPQQSSPLLIEMKKNVHPIQYQMVENRNVGAEQLGMDDSQIRTGTSYDRNKGDKPLTENNDTGKFMIQPRETQRILTQVREKLPLGQYQVVENMNVGTDQLNAESSQVMISTPAFQEQPVFSGNVKGKINSTPDMSYARSTVPEPKHEILPKIAVSEHSKSVRFNLGQNNNQAESKSMFGGPSMFGNIFSPFSNRIPMQNESLMQEPETGTNIPTFNMSLMEPAEENSRIGLDFNSGQNESHMRSPDFSYEMEEGVQQSIKSPEMPPFGGGGFFSFGKNMFKF